MTTISLPVSVSTKRSAEKYVEVSIPSFREKLIENKYIQAFLTVLRAPVE